MPRLDPTALLPLCALASLVAACAPPPVVITGVTVSPHEDVATLLWVDWTQDSDADAAWLEIELSDGTMLESAPLERAAGTHREVVLGAPAGMDLVLRVVAENRGGESLSGDQTARTGSLPEDLTLPELGVWDTQATNPAGWVLGSVDVNGGTNYSGPYWLFIADRQGRIVWYRELGWEMCMFPRVARDGTHIAWDAHLFLEPTGEDSRVERSTLDGRWSDVVATPGLGWTWDETDDGTVLYDKVRGGDTITLEQVNPDGSQQTLWDCGAWLAPTDGDLEGCSTNTTNWVPATDTVLWSTYWGDWVAELDRATGEVIWYAGAVEGGLDITPAEAAFELQHYPNYTPDGTLLVSTHVPGQKGEQRAREYVVDVEGGTLTEIWAYGEGAEGYYAPFSGEAVRLAGGNTLVNTGTGGGIIEVDPIGRTVWSLAWGQDFTVGHTQLIEDLYAVNRGW
jgi:hypothetical protein